MKPFLLSLLAAVIVLVAQPAPSATNDNGTGQHSSQERQADDDEAKTAGQSIVVLDRQTQALAGIETITLAPARFQDEMIAYGQVVSLQPLLDLRGRYFNAVAEHSKAKANLEEAEQAMARINDLHKIQAASTRQLQQQRSLLQTAKAEYQASRYRLKAVQESTLLDWGKRLADWVFSPDSEQFSQLIMGEKTLLLISLQPNQSLPDSVDSVYFSPSGRRAGANKAMLLSSVPHTDATFQGKTYFFLADQKIRSGMHVTAWFPRQRESLVGVQIPASAIIRHLGEQYVYLQTGATQFTRHRITDLIDTGTGYFIQKELVPGDRLVTTGAQMLLSEEFRGRIPDEDDDD